MVSGGQDLKKIGEQGRLKRSDTWMSHELGEGVMARASAPKTNKLLRDVLYFKSRVAVDRLLRIRRKVEACFFFFCIFF